jgi:SAM-dependent methyltransferase
MSDRSADIPLPRLVCPLHLEDVSDTDLEHRRCARGHEFGVVKGMPDFTIMEDVDAHLHHRPDRRLSAFPSYDEERRGRPRSGAPSFGSRLRRLAQLVRNASWYRRMVPRACARLLAELSPPPAPPPDAFPEIFGPGLYAHELLKRLEKEAFWDRLSLRSPSYEVGTSDGHASRYFFQGRTIDFGSEFLLKELVASQSPHRVRFSASLKFLPFPDASLETVLCSQTITCIYASIVSILAEVNRVLRPGGRFVFTTHGPAYLRGLPLEGWPAMGLSAQDCLRRNEERSNYMAHLYTAEEWRQLLAAAGFELAETRGLLSLDVARYSHLFYFTESYGPNVFRAPYRQGRVGRLVRALFGGARAYDVCDRQYRALMQRALAHELKEHGMASFDDRRYLDAGLVAVKRISVSSTIPRLDLSRQVFPGPA